MSSVSQACIASAGNRRPGIIRASGLFLPGRFDALSRFIPPVYRVYSLLMRSSLLALALFVVGTTAQAQSPSFGLKAGLNVANISFEDEDDFFDIPGIDKQPRLGFVGGVTADVPFSSSFGLRAEVLYSQKGYAVHFDPSQVEALTRGGFDEGTVTAKIDYLEVPVLANVMFPMQNGLEIGLQAGLAPAFKLSTGVGCSGFEDSNACEDFEADENDPDGIKSFDLGGALGLTVGAGPFAVDARYTMSLTTIDEDDGSGIFDPVDARNGVVSLTGVYRFGR